MLSVQNNMLAMNADRQLKTNVKKNSKNTEKLSSGYRINRGADDAAGLSLSEKMRRQIRGLHQSADNISEGVGYVQTAEGALTEVQDMLQRMNELAVKSANGTNTEEDRKYIDQEVQQIKAEINRIFSTTTFNDKLIWEPNTKIQVGTVKKQAAEFLNTTVSIDVTNKNCGAVAYNGYKVNADAADGVSISWTGWDGKSYETKKIDWDTLKENNYSFEMSNYFDDTDANQAALFDNGTPVFKHKVAFTVEETATIDDIVACIDGGYFSSYSSVSMSGRYEKANGSATSAPMSVYETSLNYGAAYASYIKGNGTHNFDAADDTFLEPSNASGTKLSVTSTTGNVTSIPAATKNLSSPPTDAQVTAAKASNETWKLSFNMAGLGLVTAESCNVEYYADDQTDDDYGIWWHWNYNKTYKYATSHDTNSGTLGSLMSVLKNNGNQSLLHKTDATDVNNGNVDTKGYIELHFNLTAANAFTEGSVKNQTNVGSFSLKLEVTASDTEASILKKVSDSLNSASIVDFYTTSSRNDSHTFYTASANNHKIDVPIYEGTTDFWVQGGADSGQHIGITYDAFTLNMLGIKKTNVLTTDNSGDAIDEIKTALQMVSEQRSDFGAYQNRLEHAYHVNTNTEENTQSAESVIRDTDIADMMVSYSNNNILLQAGTSMLTQANQQADYILQLLQ